MLALAVAGSLPNARADHGSVEGCVISPAVHACSAPDTPDVGPGPGSYTVTSGHTVGAAGVGPVSISWTDPDGLGPCLAGSFSAGAGEQVDRDADENPLVGPGCVGTVVSVSSGGGTAAVGDDG